MQHATCTRVHLLESLWVGLGIQRGLQLRVGEAVREGLEGKEWWRGSHGGRWMVRGVMKAASGGSAESMFGARISHTLRIGL